jgi:hypothetical protein
MTILTDKSSKTQVIRQQVIKYLTYDKKCEIVIGV